MHVLAHRQYRKISFIRASLAPIRQHSDQISVYWFCISARSRVSCSFSLLAISASGETSVSILMHVSRISRHRLFSKNKPSLSLCSDSSSFIESININPLVSNNFLQSFYCLWTKLCGIWQLASHTNCKWKKFEYITHELNIFSTEIYLNLLSFLNCN